MEITEKDIGRYVVYNDNIKPSEVGRIKSLNAFFIFVVYKCNNDWENYKDYTGCATKREHLKFKE